MCPGSLLSPGISIAFPQFQSQSARAANSLPQQRKYLPPIRFILGRTSAEENCNLPKVRSVIRICLLNALIKVALLGSLAEGVVSAQQTRLTEKLAGGNLSQLAGDVTRFGDPVRGAIAFFRPEINCAKCHEPGDRGRRLGPDLAERREISIEKLADSILHPSAEIREGFETTLLMLDDGRQISGIVLDETAATVRIDRIEESSEPLSVSQSEIEDRKKTTLSTMPEALANQLADRSEFLDLVRYLQEIAHGGPARAAQLLPTTSMAAIAPLPEYESRIDHRGMIGSMDQKLLAQGAEIYRLRCASCHGDLDGEGSMPTSLRFPEGKFKRGNDPYTMYQTLTHGYGMMNPQRWMVPEQKYAVIHYIRTTFLKRNNPTQMFAVTDEYLSGLPAGDTRGPKPVESRPWTLMNYGPSLINTIEVSKDGSNIAQKGIAMRLDDGPGGVESGSYWMMYDHDTMRMAGAWSGAFIDYNGIHFNGVHGQHPKVAGPVHVHNPTGPGWGRPGDGSFEDNRLTGRDNKRYGPLDRSWVQYRGMYRYGKQTIIRYTVGKTEILESPALQFAGDRPVFVRSLEIGARDGELILQVAKDARPFIHRAGAMVSLDETAITDNLQPADPNPVGLVVSANTGVGPVPADHWLATDDGNLRLRIPAGDNPVLLKVLTASVSAPDQVEMITNASGGFDVPARLEHLTRGGPPNWPEVLETKIAVGPDDGPYAVDVLTHPVNNPWNCLLRTTGVDFVPGEDAAYVCTWDGGVWKVSGIGETATGSKLQWRRIAAGLFQPLGIKLRDGVIFVTCRDQLVLLHDLNGDGEMDWYECYNNDHQVTEHFHEFAMGLQIDANGNFYYAKSARHALPALIPHHGTLLKISADGQKTEIIANGFRAANGVCLNPDGSFVVTDQEGHWNPKNRINWVTPGGFYGNMFGYHDVTDSSDDAMVPPLCWITNSFDRSPAELMWVDSDRWGPLEGSLLNFSYGYGKIYVCPHEQVDGQMQGGMCAFDLPQFPTGIMRGRFNPVDGQLYCCGMFAWSGTQEQPGGLYRIRYTGQSANLPVGLHALETGVEIVFSDPVDPGSVSDPANFAIQAWDLKRTANYGSDHYNERRWPVESARLLPDGKTVSLTIPDIAPTWGMEIVYAIQAADGKPLQGKIHNTIHKLGTNRDAIRE